MKLNIKNIVFFLISIVFIIFLFLHESTDGHNFYLNKYSAKYLFFLVTFITNFFIISALILFKKKDSLLFFFLSLYFFLSFYILTHFFNTNYLIDNFYGIRDSNVDGINSTNFTPSIFSNKFLIILLFILICTQIWAYKDLMFHFLNHILSNIKNLFRKKIIIYQLSVLIILFLILEFSTRIIIDKDVTNINFKDNNEDKKFLNLNKFGKFPYQNQSHPYLGYVMKSNLKTQHIHKDLTGKEYTINYFTNSSGFRDHELDKFVKESPNEKLIIFLGGSSALGVGTSNKDNVDEILERELNKISNKHKYKVLNLSIGGGNAYQSFLALDLYGKNLKPDYIILSDGRNDGYLSFVHGYDSKNYNRYPTIEYYLNNFFFNQPSPSIFFGSIFNYVLKYSRFIQIITGKKHIDKKILEDINNKSVSFNSLDETLNFYLKSTENIVKFFEDSQIIFATQPIYYKIIDKQYSISTLENFKNKNRDKNSDQVDYYQFSKYWITLISNSVKKKYEKFDNVEHIDANLFYKDFSVEDLNKMFIDDCHLTKTGNEVFVKNIINLILDNYDEKKLN